MAHTRADLLPRTVRGVPEGDSVHRLAARLRAGLDGRLVVAGELRGGRAAGTDLTGRTVLGHDTHGKHLLTRFDTGETLHTHLRMDGSWTVTAAGRRLPARVLPDVRLRMETDEGRTAWGISIPVVELLATRDEDRVVGHLGPDPLREDWDEGEARRRVEGAGDQPVVAVLLDQTRVAGLGNLWANELCFLRGLHPWRPVASVDVPALVALAARCLRLSATVPDMYQVTTGDRRRGERHWVAGRAGRPCKRCGTTVLVRAEVPGDPARRRTWWCPRCQPEA